MRGSDPAYALTRNEAAFYPPTLKIIHHFVAFLKWRFSLLPVGTYHWVEEGPDGRDSEIFIGASTPINTQVVGQRPAITVLRSQAAFQGMGMGDRMHTNWATGGRTYLDMIPTTVVINVLSRIDIVAERLAFFVQEQFFTLREELIRTEPCLLYCGARTSISPPSPAGTLTDSVKPDWTCVSLALPVFLQHVTSKMPVNKPILSDLKLTSQSR